MPVRCKFCESLEHTQFYCRLKPRKPIKVNKRPKQAGKRATEYKNFRDQVAIPFLTENFGYKCARCGVTDNLDVDHIQGRGSHPELKMNLTNLQFLCRSCHQQKTDRR